MVYKFFVSVLVVLFFAFVGALSAQDKPRGVQDPLKGIVIVISDLHFGRGEQAIGQYYPQEDFQWGGDFVTFLDAIHRAGGGKITLVIAGDMFELWESPDRDCLSEDHNWGCSEEEAIKRIIKIVSAHRVELQALGEFASRGENRVIIVPGNHDGALLFQGVWNIVKAAARPSRPERFELAGDGRWIAPSGNVVVEHGHQFDDANSFSGWPKSVNKDSLGVPRLPSPFGERLVREFFDPLEQKYPVVDNITGSAGLFYGIKREGVVGTAGVFGSFLKLLLIDSSWRQFTEFLSDDGAQRPVWDIAAVRSSGTAFFIDGFPPGDPVAPLVKDVIAAADPSVSAAANQALASMTDDEVNTVCQSRFVSRLQAEKEGVPADKQPSLCPRVGGDLGYLDQKAVQKVKGSLYYVGRYVDQVIAPLPMIDKDSVVFVYGHTHAATRATRLNARFTVINTGAWQRLISADALAIMAKAKSWSSNQVLQSVRLADLPACYSFVWIPWEYGKPSAPKLRYWATEGDVWKFSTSCGAREILPAE